MKQIKKRLINILNKELFIDRNLLSNENARLENNLHLNPTDLNLLLYYFERDLKIEIPDEKMSLSQNLNEFAKSIYQIKKYTAKLAKAS